MFEQYITSKTSNNNMDAYVRGIFHESSQRVVFGIETFGFIIADRKLNRTTCSRTGIELQYIKYAEKKLTTNQ